MLAYNPAAPKRPVNLSLNADLVRHARVLVPNLSEKVESMLRAFVEEEQRKRAQADEDLQATLAAWNEFDARVGSFAEEHSIL